MIEEYGTETWEAAETKARVDQGFLDGVKRKHPLLITATLEVLYGDGKQSETLEKFCSNLLGFAATH
jgi:hypothetical protein